MNTPSLWIVVERVDMKKNFISHLLKENEIIPHLTYDSQESFTKGIEHIGMHIRRQMPCIIINGNFHKSSSSSKESWHHLCNKSTLNSLRKITIGKIPLLLYADTSPSAIKLYIQNGLQQLDNSLYTPYVTPLPHDVEKKVKELNKTISHQ